MMLQFAQTKVVGKGAFPLSAPQGISQGLSLYHCYSCTCTCIHKFSEAAHPHCHDPQMVVIISHHYTIMLFLAHYNMLKKLAHYAFKKYPLCTTNLQLFSSNVMLDQLVLHMRCTWLILRSCWDDGEGRDLVQLLCLETVSYVC